MLICCQTPYQKLLKARPSTIYGAMEHHEAQCLYMEERDISCF